MKRGKLIVVSGPSGAGKSTVLHRILDNHPDFKFSVSATTRSPRPGETPGKDYHFITVEEFQKLIQNKALLEYNHYASGDYYGTPSAPMLETMEQGGTAILDVDPHGAFQVRQHCPEAILIFLAPPSLAELRSRLEYRGDTSPEKMEARLQQARWELRQAREYTYLVVNDQVDSCVERMEQIISGAPEAEESLFINNEDLKILKEVL